MRLQVAFSLLVLFVAACTRSEDIHAPLPVKEQAGHEPMSHGRSSAPSRITGEGIDRKNPAETRFQTTDWHKISLPGKTLELIDPVKIEVLQFSADGYVSATIGTKEALAGPIFLWKIKNGILLISEDNDSSVATELSKPRIHGDPLSVLDQTLSVTEKNGGEIQYKLSQTR
ncbi:hypothetical protein F2P44_30510 [Massilia sp. CCM 8695]|uniref:Lipocalin-like domain-containing protein n=1 Tax=Massilia frigida TaxID=2609281 RepID=A0ABX0NE27_9BURK|nr:hypothetical protein [Massilia frigida]NHZ83568.1 hypothetical protein [Massilia frigida]